MIILYNQKIKQIKSGTKSIYDFKVELDNKGRVKGFIRRKNGTTNTKL